MGNRLSLVLPEDCEGPGEKVVDTFGKIRLKYIEYFFDRLKAIKDKENPNETQKNYNEVYSLSSSLKLKWKDYF